MASITLLLRFCSDDCSQFSSLQRSECITSPVPVSIRELVQYCSFKAHRPKCPALFEKCLLVLYFFLTFILDLTMLHFCDPGASLDQSLSERSHSPDFLSIDLHGTQLSVFV